METKGETIREAYEDMFKEILNKEYTEELHDGGIARLYKTPKIMAERAIDYLTDTFRKGEPITFEGLRLHMKFWKPETFYNYQKQKQYTQDFKRVTEIIQLIIRNVYVAKLNAPKTFPGAKFVLQCNYGMVPVERQIVENHDIEVVIGKKQEDETDGEKH